MVVNRRHFLMLLGASVGTLALENFALAENNPSNNQPGVVQLPPLPYLYDALEPYIDARTMQIHHDRHHGSYVKNLNEALDKYPTWKNIPVEDILKNINKVPGDIQTKVRNNGGGHVNHSMFWRIMKPNGGGAPTGEIADVINQSFGNFENFKKQFNAAGASRFGSGWVWLVRNPDGKIEITTTPNQDSPFMANQYPIMGNDVWEHAYYLKYQNRRPEYLEAWWNVVNWDEINRRLAAAKIEGRKQRTGGRS